MHGESKDSDLQPASQAESGWDGVERRRNTDRRSGERRLDERRRAGIGEIMGERRARRGRRVSDLADEPDKRSDRRVTHNRRANDTR